MSIIWDIIEKIVLVILSWLVLFPIVLIVGTPIVLIVSLFGKNGSYPNRVSNGYCTVFDLWLDNGLWWVLWGDY